MYKLKRTVPNDCHKYLRFYEEAIIHGQAVASELMALKEKGFVPDLIIGHSWGNSMFVKEVFPKTPYISHVEWYYNYENSDVDFVNKDIEVNQKAELVCKNSHILQDLVKSDLVLTSTEWQKQQIPEIFYSKVKVIHEGISTEYFKPDKNAQFKIPNTDIVLTRKNKVLTYATRGMEEYRGFPQFMTAASILMQQEPDLQVVVAGDDKVCYGRQITGTSFKREMLKMFKFDMSRLHFVGTLPYKDYLNLLQVSSAHIYLTYPFVLSWSMLEAMSAGCNLVASDTPPVTEYIKNNYNGLLVEFNDINAIVKSASDIINNREKYAEMPQNARRTVIERCDLKNMLEQRINLIKEFVK